MQTLQVGWFVALTALAGWSAWKVDRDMHVGFLLPLFVSSIFSLIVAWPVVSNLYAWWISVLPIPASLLTYSTAFALTGAICLAFWIITVLLPTTVIKQLRKRTATKPYRYNQEHVFRILSEISDLCKDQEVSESVSATKALVSRHR